MVVDAVALVYHKYRVIRTAEGSHIVRTENLLFFTHGRSSRFQLVRVKQDFV